MLLDRYGVVTREAVAADDGPAPWGEVLQQLRRMEWRGEVRQGYFVAGLTGVQFARADAVERLRGARGRTGAPPLLVNACDPANPYGTVLPWPEGERLARVPSNYLVLANGRPVLGVEGHGSRLIPLVPLKEDRLAEALAASDRPAEGTRGGPPAAADRGTPVGRHAGAEESRRRAVRALGFEPSPRGLVYYG